MEEGGVEALPDEHCKKPNLKNRTDAATEQVVVELAIENPALGQVRVSNELRERGVFISPAGVCCVWLRHGLQKFKLRLKALEKRAAEEGQVLTEDQLAALEKRKQEQEACGEIETAHPGSQDTSYVGTIKVVGGIYQQTFIDTYSKIGFAKLYTMKTPITAVDLPNDRVLPFFVGHEMSVLRILTDHGTEYCGQVDSHDYQLFLAIHDIDHSRTKTNLPQINGICERFHKTIQEGFYQITCRRAPKRSRRVDLEV